MDLEGKYITNREGTLLVYVEKIHFSESSLCYNFDGIVVECYNHYLSILKVKNNNDLYKFDPEYTKSNRFITKEVFENKIEQLYQQILN